MHRTMLVGVSGVCVGGGGGAQGGHQLLRVTPKTLVYAQESVYASGPLSLFYFPKMLGLRCTWDD